MQAEWTTIRDRLLKTVGQNNFTTWIDPLTVGPIEDGICTLFVPTNFFGNYVSQNFADTHSSFCNKKTKRLRT